MYTKLFVYDFYCLDFYFLSVNYFLCEALRAKNGNCAI